MSAVGHYAKLANSAKPDVASQLDERQLPKFLTAKQAAALLHINEKKVYSLASEGSIPATKITGKWLFPLNLIEQWLVDNSHQGVLSDRLLIAGCDDSLIHRVVTELSATLGEEALVSFSPTSARDGLKLLDRNRVDACVIHWGPADQSTIQHLALLRHYQSHSQWVLCRLMRRQQGLYFSTQRISRSDHATDWLLDTSITWVKRSDGSSSQRLLNQLCISHSINPHSLSYTEPVFSERASAACVVRGEADAGAGACSIANEFGLGFLPITEETIDMVVSRKTYFRTLFQTLLAQLTNSKSESLAAELGGYRFVETGQVFTLDDHKRSVTCS